jgi:hypothetical protein
MNLGDSETKCRSVNNGLTSIQEDKAELGEDDVIQVASEIGGANGKKAGGGCENHCEDHCLSIGEGHHQCPKDADNQVFKMIRVVEIVKVVRSPQEISNNLSGNLIIEIPSCEKILVSPICPHSLMTKYLVICGILSKNNYVAFCNAFPKTELSPAREDNTLLTHHNQLSLPNKS